MCKRVLSLVLAVLMALSLCAPAFASGEPAADVPAVETPAVETPAEDAAAEEVPEKPEPVPEDAPASEPIIVAATEESPAAEDPVPGPTELADQPEVADVYSGTCENGTIDWLLEECGTDSSGDSVYKITFSGSGELTNNYGDEWDDLMWKDISTYDIVTAIINKGISSIGQSAFSYFTHLTSVSIPDTIKSIGERAFIGCDNLKELTIPSSVTSIGEDAFNDCGELERVTILNPDCVLGANLFGRGCYMDPILCGYAGSTAYVYAYEDDRDFSCIGVIRSVSGHCGENVIWDLSVYGTLTISGTGAMNYYSAGDTPWDYCSEYIKAVDVLNGVTSITSHAFQNIKSLTHVTVAGSVTSIGEEAFKGTPWLEEQGDFLVLNGYLFEYMGAGGNVLIPYGVRVIKNGVFSNCLSMTNVSIPSSVQIIEAEAFHSCISLTSVEIPNGVTTIGEGAFEYCTALSSVSIPDSITSIGRLAFDSCDTLKQVDIPGSVKEIEFRSFADCPSLNTVTFQSGVTHIGEQAFRDCLSLSSISFPASVTKIDGAASYNCRKLTSVTILNPSCEIDNGHSINIGGDPLKGADEYAYYATFPEAATIYGYTGSTAEIFARENGYSFKSLGAAPATSTPEPTVEPSTPTPEPTAEPTPEPTVEPTPTPEGDIVASGTLNFGLTWALSADGVLTISGQGAMDGSHFENRPWHEYRDYVHKAVVSEGVTQIGNYAFSGCSYLTSVTIASSVTSIRNSAFSDCTGLTEITIPEMVQYIGNDAFSGCTSLARVNFQSVRCDIGDSEHTLGVPGTTVIYGYHGAAEDYANRYNYSFVLVSPVVDKGICGPNLTWELTDDGTLTISGTGDMFNYGEQGPISMWDPEEDNYISLKEVNPWYPDYYGFYNDFPGFSQYEIKTVVIGEGVTSIGDRAFCSISALTSVTIPDGVTRIGNSAFYGCGLVSVTIPESVVSIEEDAFAHCKALADVQIGSSLAEIGSNAFASTPWLEAKNGDFVIVSSALVKYQGSGTSVTIPNEVTCIGPSAFANCSELVSVTIPDSVTNIGSSAFSGCTKLKNVSFFGRLTDVGVDAFTSTPWLEKNKNDFVTLGGVLLKYKGSKTILTVPGGVTSIGPYAFFGNTGVTSVTLGSGVTAISYAAFRNCTGLTSVFLGDGLRVIGSDAFENCKKLANVVIPDSVIEIGLNAFVGCASLISAEMPAGVSELIGTFDSCTALKTVTVMNPDCVLTGWETSRYPGGEGGEAASVASSDSPAYADLYDSYCRFCPKTTTIRGYAGSTAEEYALAHGNPFEAINDQPAKKNGLIKENGRTYFYKDGVKQTGIVTVDSKGRKCYFSAKQNGAMLTGLITVDTKGRKCYFSAKQNGYMLVGVVNTGGGTLRYFRPSDGYMLKGGWISVNGARKYYADKNGVLYTGYKTIGGKSYYFSVKDGHLMKGGIVTGPGNHQYYVSAKDGHAMKGGWARGLKVNGRTGYSYYYYLDKTGIVRVTRELSTSTKVSSIPIPRPSEYQN